MLLVFILIDGLLYCGLAMYLDQVVPVGYGANRKPWYIFQKQYYEPTVLQKSFFSASFFHYFLCQIPYNIFIDDLEANETNEDIHVDAKRPITIKVRKVKKIFQKFGGGFQVGLSDFNLDICGGEITAIVGHSKAGKSLFLDSLIGMVTIDSGIIQVYGYDIK